MTFCAGAETMVSDVSSSELIAIGILLALSVLGSVVAQLVFGRLERHHREEWERLGRPNLFRVSAGKSLELVRFVVTGRFAGPLARSKIAAVPGGLRETG